MDPTPYDVLAVELSSFQLHYTRSLSAESAVVLNLAEDHLDWYAGPDGMADYAADKGRIYAGVERACVYNAADPVTEQLVRDADVQEGARAIGFTLGTPSVGMIGVVGCSEHGAGRTGERRPGVPVADLRVERVEVRLGLDERSADGSDEGLPVRVGARAERPRGHLLAQRPERRLPGRAHVRPGLGGDRLGQRLLHSGQQRQDGEGEAVHVQRNGFIRSGRRNVRRH